MMTEAVSKPKAVIVHGLGCSKQSHWYTWMERKLVESDLFSEVILEDMPDPHEAKRSIWIPFIQSLMKGDSKNSVVIGHSSGAVAAMRLLEDTPLLGCVLVSACHSDLGAESERISGYYPGFRDGVACPNEWQFDKIKSNAQWILQYHSADDPFIPPTEANYVAEKLQSEYKLFEGKGHICSISDFESSSILPDLLAKLTSSHSL